MLQQILQDLWVDPEILAELDESQKQTLFCRMREEQVRRWKLWDQQQEAPNRRTPEPAVMSKPKALDVKHGTKIIWNKYQRGRGLGTTPMSLSSRTQEQRIFSQVKTAGEKHVDFLLASDGEPWVWIMGEHPDDKSIEQILEEEAREKARKQAEKEAEQMRLSVEAELSELLDLNAKQIQALESVQITETSSEEDAMDIYCSVDEISKKLEDEPFMNKNNNKLNENSLHINNSLLDNRETIHEINFNKPKKVAQRVAMWEKKLMEERTTEIFQTLKRKQQEAKREAEEAERHQERLWREQERKAKEAELQIREIARRAREEHRRTSVLETNTETETVHKSESMDLSSSSSSSLSSSLGSVTFDNSSTAKPPSKEAVIEWFRSSELGRRAGMEITTNTVAPWFHGLITRQEAESLLSNKPPGSFLLRISERIWGYAITYKDTDRCKHYLVDASNGHYQFLGANHVMHDTLYDMVKYHTCNPITESGGELLLHPCTRIGLPAIFKGLLSSSKW